MRVVVETGEDAGEVAHAEIFGENLAEDRAEIRGEGQASEETVP